MEDLAQLAEQIRQQIPLTRQLEFALVERIGDRLVLTAPLAPNQNDKGTMFAGSISTLCTLAGWALTGLLAKDRGFTADVLAVRNAIEFKAPIEAAVTVTATAVTAMLDEFGMRLARKGRARLAVTVEACVDGQVCASFQADYLARVLPVSAV